MMMRRALSSVRFRLKDVHCPSCLTPLENKLAVEPGVKRVASSPTTRSVVLQLDDQQTSRERVAVKIRELGFHIDESERKGPSPTTAVVCSALTLPMVLMHLEPWVQLGLCVPVLLAGGKGFFRAAWRKGLGVDALVSIGIGSSFLHGLVLLALGEPVGHEHFHNTAMITTIMNWGNFLEESASASASKELSKRLEGRSTDEMVSRVQNGNVEQVFVDEVQEGDHVIVKSGERIPVDGIVESGSAWVDESILTGESVPVSKDVGSLVSAGTTITISSGEKGGAILIQAQAVGPATFESAISRQLEVLRATKSSMQRYADQVSAIFVPGVLSISASSLIGWSFLKGDVHTGLEAAVSVLVAACPCALGLATPSAIQVGIGQACKSGIIFQSAHSLENAGSLDAICFDKTGTLTEDVPVVEKIEYYCRPEYVQKVLKSLCQFSSHPLDQALHSNFSENQQIQSYLVQNFKVVEGFGLEGWIDQNHVLLGSSKLMERHNVHIADTIAHDGSISFLSINGTLAASTFFTESMRPSALEVVSSLQNDGVKVFIASGDRTVAVEKVAKALGIPRDHAFGNLSPTEKAELIQSLKSSKLSVGFVGDGINDLLAIQAADVGFGFGARKGSARALETSDVALFAQDLGKLERARFISSSTKNKIRQNLALAFGYNAIALPLAALGTVAPAEASLMHSGSTALVVANALLLKFYLK